jgi:D-alanyl-D-alanine carboxypeptidase (penicillin-binding protein 5/6)
MEYNNIKQPNRNKLLWRDSSVDGLKTGFTDAAGYCLVASAQRNGMRLISVVMGAPSGNARIDATEALLNWGFRNYSTHQLYAANQPLAQSRVWYGAQKTVSLGLAQPLTVTIPSHQYQNLKALLTVDDNLQAPITKGQAYGKVDVMLNNQLLRTVPVVALADNPRGSVFERAYDKFLLFFHG